MDNAISINICNYYVNKKAFNKDYKTTCINNRRYLGNKYKLLNFIKSVVESECNNIKTVADIFAGTGAVASAFIDKKIITNDIMYSNYICHVAWFSKEEYSEEKIIKYICHYNKINVEKENYMSINFSDTFFSRENCLKIGYIREDINKLYNRRKINFREKAILITSLLYAMDKIANTCGHYDAYIRNKKMENKELELFVPKPSKTVNPNNECYNEDSNKLIKKIEADLVYIDPPYNSRQYCDAYHLLENVARWDKPNVYGIAKKMDRSFIKSDYCTMKATSALEELVENIKAKYILLSYNNMAEKGNGRSNAKISDKDIISILKRKGEVKVFSKNYKSFTAGKSNHNGNEERLFLCICENKKDEKIVYSPLNYIGGKHKLLPQILPHFPKDIDMFLDLFCGGCNVGVNISAKNIIFNDKNEKLISLYNTFKNLEKEIIFKFIDIIIKKYKLSVSKKYNYEYYKCNSMEGLSKYNKDRFIKLRNDFNLKNSEGYYYYIMFYVLVVYSFNNQIRFNKKGEFNLPVGKRDFNLKMEQKLSIFLDKINKSNIKFINKDFRDFNISKLNERSFIYADPPYLISHATYNEQNAWSKKDEHDLLDFLDELDKKNIKFALSNVIKSKGKTNNILIKWIKKNKYRVINLQYSYSNSNYQVKNRNYSTEEVLIVNY